MVDAISTQACDALCGIHPKFIENSSAYAFVDQLWGRAVSSWAGEAQEELATEERNLGEEYTKDLE